MPFLFANVLSFFMLNHWVHASSPNKPVIHPFEYEVEGAGCMWMLGKQTLPVLVSDGQYHMHLDGKMRHFSHAAETETPAGSVFEGEGYTIRVTYGHFKTYEGGGSYKQTLIKVTKNRQTTTLKAHGGCAC